jgi:hypothetical protein
MSVVEYRPTSGDRVHLTNDGKRNAKLNGLH